MTWTAPLTRATPCGVVAVTVSGSLPGWASAGTATSSVTVWVAPGAIGPNGADAGVTVQPWAVRAASVPLSGLVPALWTVTGTAAVPPARATVVGTSADTGLAGIGRLESSSASDSVTSLPPVNSIR